jgi:hypothetical protein
MLKNKKITFDIRSTNKDDLALFIATLRAVAEDMKIKVITVPNE